MSEKELSDIAAKLEGIKQSLVIVGYARRICPHFRR